MAQTKKKKPAAKSSAKKSPAKKSVAKMSAKTSTKTPVKKPVKKAVKKAVAVIKKIAKKAAASITPAYAPKTSVSKASSAKKASPKSIPSAFQPLDDRLIISVEPMPTKTAGGLFIPDTATERQSRGTVLAKGPGKRNKKGMIRPLDVSVGDMVLFPQFAGQKIEIGSEEFLILREEEILGITT